MKYLFAIHELWKIKMFCLQNRIMNIFVCITWIMKIFCLQYMNNENIKMFVCTTWIMKKIKYLLSIHELWKYCLKYMHYEKMKIFVWNICLQ